MTVHVYNFPTSGPNRLAPPVLGGEMCGLYPMAWRGGQLRPHSGIDLCAPRGTPIIMPLPGVVTRKTRTDHGGNNFTVRHDGGFVTYYAHCDDILVDVDQPVRQFEIAATVGQTGVNTYGNAVDPHLHWQVQATEDFSSTHYSPEALLDTIGIYRQGLVYYWKEGFPQRPPSTVRAAGAFVVGAAVVVGLTAVAGKRKR